MLFQNSVWLRLAEAALPPFLFLLATPIAFKHVILPSRSQELRNEFYTLGSIYDSCDTGFFFAIPQLLASHDPNNPASFVAPPRSPYWTSRRRPLGPHVTEGDFKCSTSTLPPLRWIMSNLFFWSSQTVRKLFYSPISSTAQPLHLSCLLSESHIGGWQSQATLTRRTSPWTSIGTRCWIMHMNADILMYKTLSLVWARCLGVFTGALDIMRVMSSL